MQREGNGNEKHGQRTSSFLTAHQHIAGYSAAAFQCHYTKRIGRDLVKYSDTDKKLTRRWDSERELSYDDIFNHFYAVRTGSYRIPWNNVKRVITLSKVIQGHRFWYQSKAYMRLPV